MSGARMQQLKTAYRAWSHVKLVGALVSGVAIFAMMLFIVADVVSRNYLGGSIAGSFEVAQNYFMPLAVFPALAYVYSSGVLPRMDLLRDRLPQAVEAATIHVLVVLELIVFALLVHYTWGYAMSGMDRGVAFPAGGSLYTLWPLFFLVPIGFAMVLIETLFVLAHNIMGDTVSLAVLPAEEEARP
ncbi:TRAP transporter small permease [Aeromicrobium sp. CTD01-1L150]|uniref:TRAP transporter small permease n=1 Tax=Aeromicrobium sp. CTD01-1L150 TaxID=3341830 RepID=UPI0035BFCDCB